ncbi:cytochrome c [Denitrobaculum tricleocarpae]|uniref:Cytochrome c n=1 Tax=Denitrobaculum tricleocarpae TaxID=2591009 RepID=A0A545TKW6_9PROT|nr:cytochrome c [Denitrobaculum tricleocarpae]TQV77847.1 hypothetical protein FKG95_20045 [Denitrobaculum tricleocarpae]
MRALETGTKYPALHPTFHNRHRSLKKKLCAALLAASLALPLAPVSAEEDPRAAVQLPADVAAAFLAEMRTHMANLDDVMAALAEEDFEAAASIAELQMTQGHHRWASMAKQGASEEEIAAAKERFKARRAARDGQMGDGQMGAGGGQGQGKGMGGGMAMGPGFGRYMPEDFRAMGDVFHEAAESFAATARNAASPATPEDYRALLEGLQEITMACRACHDAYKVEVVR